MTAPSAPSAITAIEPHAYLCEAWGESDLPAALVATSRAEVLKFLEDEWFGEAPDAEVVKEFDSHDWREEGPLEWKFEIGGVKITKVSSLAARSSTGDTEKEKKIWLAFFKMHHFVRKARLEKRYNLPADDERAQWKALVFQIEEVFESLDLELAGAIPPTTAAPV